MDRDREHERAQQDAAGKLQGDAPEGMGPFEAAFEGAAVGMILEDAEGRILRSNHALRRMLRYGEEELRGMVHRDFTHPEDAGKDAGLYGELLRGERESFRIEKRYLKKDGGVMWGRLSASRVGSTAEGMPLVMGVIEDIDELRRTQTALGASESRFRTVVEQSPLSIHVFTPEGRSIRANASWNELWYLNEGEEPEGGNIFEDQQLRAAGLIPYVRDATAGVEAKIPPLLFDPARVGRQGEPRWLEGVIYPLRDAAGDTSEVTLILQDVTERKELEDRLAYQALHDPLTNLPNRTLFLDRLGQALARRSSQRDTEWDILQATGHHFASHKEGIAVLFLDLDDLKYVNDSLGHESGDVLLVEVARRLKSRVRPADTVARLGGDEFVILLERVGEEDAIRTAERISEEIDRPFVTGGQEVFTSVSVGIRMCNVVGDLDAGQEARTLLRQADLAMYEAKRRGKARYVLYEERMGREAGTRLELERDLRRALTREEIGVYYQPEVSLKSRRVVGAEALARWHHPERGLVPPDEFIGLAEETGLIVEIGYQILRLALEQARDWRERWSEHRREPGGEDPPMVWVNLSARQFHEPDMVERISGAIEEVGLDPGTLGLEITESILVEDASPSVSLLEELKRLGVKLAVDDFGTGYSSLSYLTRLPVDYLKIDRSFVAGLDAGGDAGSTTIISAVIGLAQAMGMAVVAEGVETEGQLSHLKTLGCDLAQGYYFARPLPFEEASTYLMAGKP